jgi:hypothetical protein
MKGLDEVVLLDDDGVVPPPRDEVLGINISLFTPACLLILRILELTSSSFNPLALANIREFRVLFNPGRGALHPGHGGLELVEVARFLRHELQDSNLHLAHIGNRSSGGVRVESKHREQTRLSLSSSSSRGRGVEAAAVEEDFEGEGEGEIG